MTHMGWHYYGPTLYARHCTWLSWTLQLHAVCCTETTCWARLHTGREYMLNPGCHMLQRDYTLDESTCCTLDTRCYLLDARCLTLHAGCDMLRRDTLWTCWMLDNMLDAACRTLHTDKITCWTLDAGRCMLDACMLDKTMLDVYSILFRGQ